MTPEILPPRMRVFRSVSDVPENFGQSAIAIGKFDGVHKGHSTLLEQLRAIATAEGLQAVVITFDRNPLALLRPDECPATLTENEHKLELLAAEGLDAALLLKFDEAFADLPAEDFVRDYLVKAFGARAVLVGRDFRFGRGAAGSIETLDQLGAELGFEVHTLQDVAISGAGQRVSSSAIREFLEQGDVEHAADLLGRPVALRGEVVHGLKRGRELGFPTANVIPASSTAVPADGVYAGWLVEQESGSRHPAAISVGTNPTFDDVHQRQVEAYVLDRTDLDLYGKVVTIEFIKRLRGMVAYTGVEALIAQMDADVVATREALGN